MSLKTRFGLRFHLKETKKNVDSFRSFDLKTRCLIEKDIRVTYTQIDGSQDLEETLKAMLAFSRDRREDALQEGASDRTHPLWNCASLIESIAFAELVHFRGDDPGGRNQEIRRIITAAMYDTLLE